MYRTSMRTPETAEGRLVRRFLKGVVLLFVLSAPFALLLHPFEPIKPYDPPQIIWVDMYPSTEGLALGLIPLAVSIALGALSLRRRRVSPLGVLAVPAGAAVFYAVWTAWMGHRARLSGSPPM